MTFLPAFCLQTMTPMPALRFGAKAAFHSQPHEYTAYFEGQDGARQHRLRPVGTGLKPLLLEQGHIAGASAQYLRFVAHQGNDA